MCPWSNGLANQHKSIRILFILVIIEINYHNYTDIYLHWKYAELPYEQQIYMQNAGRPHGVDSVYTSYHNES